MPNKKTEKLRVIPLGGVNGIGKNITVFEYGPDMIVVDCGLAFPEDNMLGVDLVIPDMSYIESNKDKLRGLFITHGHEDHIGAVPYFLKKFDVPVYGTRLTLGIIEGKFEEHDISGADLVEVKAGQTIKAGAFSVEFIKVNHSIADACALCITTPVGRVVHTGDFKIDLTPLNGEPIDLARFAELGTKGVRLLLCDSTNAERSGYTPTEKIVSSSLDRIFMGNEKRVVVATFSSNIYRVQQIINASAKNGRKVAVTGRSMLNILSAATRLGYMDIPDGLMIDVTDMKRYKPSQLTLITTGSQGEPMSALYRMAFGGHAQISLGPNDLVVLSSSSIPGNEKAISNIINELYKRGVNVLDDNIADVHVSGHACREELKLIHALVKPDNFVPVHGEYRHLVKHAALARELGMPDNRILIPETGRVIELDKRSMRFGQTVPSGQILVDGVDVREVKLADLRDRIGLVPQKGVLFSGTIESNIAYAGNVTDGDTVRWAAKIAQADTFIGEKPEGYDSEIAQGGTNVSGGQKQRLSIARALARKPEILVFDDSFSALDYRTDAKLREGLNRELHDVTKIIVAQRISTIRHAEKILVLDRGEIVGMGTHDELMQFCKVYREIATSQLSAAELA